MSKQQNNLLNLVVGCRLACKPWWGTQKSFKEECLAETAATLHAKQDMITARHKLISTSHPRFQAITRLKNQIKNVWEFRSLPYLDQGTRLVPREKYDALAEEVNELIIQLPNLVEQLDSARNEIMEEARDRLGSLYDAGNYPFSWKNSFNIEIRRVAVEPPNYLQQVSPETYQRELNQIIGDIKTCAREFVNSCYEDLGAMVESLADALRPGLDGSKKRFHESKLTNLQEFFSRVETLNITNDKDLAELANQAQTIIKGVSAGDLRGDGSQALREAIRTDLEALRKIIPSTTVTAPRRHITQVEPQLQGVS